MYLTLRGPWFFAVSMTRVDNLMEILGENFGCSTRLIAKTAQEAHHLWLTQAGRQVSHSLIEKKFSSNVATLSCPEPALPGFPSTGCPLKHPLKKAKKVLPSDGVHFSCSGSMDRARKKFCKCQESTSFVLAVLPSEVQFCGHQQQRILMSKEHKQGNTKNSHWANVGNGGGG